MSIPSVEVTNQSGIATITLNRPERGNSIDLQLAKELLAAATSCEHDAGTRAVVLTGAGRSFCFGGDLGEACESMRTM
jgi:2-(1,2-epoxy-1,2-dihydrophenyl)acetyl-CoA isomerase